MVVVWWWCVVVAGSEVVVVVGGYSGSGGWCGEVVEAAAGVAVGVEWQRRWVVVDLGSGGAWGMTSDRSEGGESFGVRRKKPAGKVFRRRRRGGRRWWPAGRRVVAGRRFTEVKTASTPMETQKPLLKDKDGEEVDVHMYRSMIGSFMYFTSSRPDIMFAAKTINGEVQIHARVDRKEIVITESSIRRDLQLADEEGGYDIFVAEQEVVHDVNENVAEEVVNVAQDSTATTTITTEEITLTQALEALKNSKPKVKGIVIQEQKDPCKSTTTATIPKQQSHDKGKGIMIEEPVKPKKKDQIRLDKEATKRLQAEFDEEERLAREKAQKEQEASIILIETLDDIHAKIDVDHQLAERLQEQEQEELSNAEKATLFQQLLEKRRKHFAAKRAKEKRNKQPTQAQKRKIMCNYLKNMKGY
nr:putative ribonuclease H-like domain-containing protein [Tanacetum cinerariifolium]